MNAVASPWVGVHLDCRIRTELTATCLSKETRNVNKETGISGKKSIDKGRKRLKEKGAESLDACVCVRGRALDYCT